jgi:hypothetical protein
MRSNHKVTAPSKNASNMASTEINVYKLTTEAKESLQQDLDFIKRLHLSASTLDGYVGAARSAAKVHANFTFLPFYLFHQNKTTLR